MPQHGEPPPRRQPAHLAQVVRHAGPGLRLVLGVEEVQVHPAGPLRAPADGADHEVQGRRLGQEPLRVLGKVENGQIVKAELPKITCQCVRVPVLNGHTAAVFINFEKKPTKEQLIEKLVNYKGFPQEAELPSAPKQFIQYLEDDNRPQVTLDVDYENGMGISIGRLREDTMYDYKFIGLSHNTVRGAAGGAVLCAEALTAKGYIAKK